MRFLAFGVTALFLVAGCAPVQVLTPAAPSGGTYYGPSPYARYAEREGKQAAFDSYADETIAANYGVYDFKEWSDAGTFGLVTAWNKTGRVMCAQVVWNFRPANTLMGSMPLVLPPDAANYVIGHWITKFNIQDFPGYSIRTWRAPAPATPGAAVTNLECSYASPFG